MKRLVVVLVGLMALPAFAEVAPFYYDDVAEYTDMEYADDDVTGDDAEIVTEDSQPSVAVKSNPRVVPASRAGLRTGGTITGANTRRSNDANSRVVAARNTMTASRTTANRGTTSRANNSSAAASTRRSTSKANVARVSVQTPVSVSGSMTTAVTNSSAGNTIPVSSVGANVVNRSSGTVSRVPAIRVSSATNLVGNSTNTNATNTSEMDQLAELTDYCKAQYTACMDNFCNVLDDNQGRCSCSKNLKNYEKTEQALKDATEELQNVAQKIQYIGLTKDEIVTLFSETEAEEAMRSKTDTSQIKSNLDKIRDMIVDVKTGTASGTNDTTMSFDLSNLLDFTISSTGFDLSALFGTATSDTSSISNQRGETLYKTATARCKTNVLNSCSAQGVDPSVITNSYDLEVDKQCITYERLLSDSNDQMTSTVRNAKAVLQKARLMVAQQKNQYDLRGCISALDSCMQDDYVCGADYENCLDPSGKYIVNGQIVVGSMPGKPLTDAAVAAGMFKTGLYKTWCKDSACSVYAWDYENNTSGDLTDYINGTMDGNPTTSDTNMSKFLQYKIGYNLDGKNYGMCMSVLNKCQNYTYTANNGKYNPKNSVVSEYLYRTMVQIKAAQDTILADYAENCISDVTSCLSSNGYDNATNKNIPVNACKSLITTCMSVNGNVASQPSPSEMATWAQNVYEGTITSTSGN